MPRIRLAALPKELQKAILTQVSGLGWSQRPHIYICMYIYIYTHGLFLKGVTGGFSTCVERCPGIKEALWSFMWPDKGRMWLQSRFRDLVPGMVLKLKTWQRGLLGVWVGPPKP